MGKFYFPNKYTTRTRRVQKNSGRATFNDAPPSSKLGLECSKPCGPCTIKYQCPTLLTSFKLGLKCMQHLMAKSRTWACIYNVNSWCAYSVSGYACWAQDNAPESKHHNDVLVYRQNELDYYLSLEGRQGHPRKNALKLCAKLLDLKEELFTKIGVQNLHVCAFYTLYSKNDHLAVINKTDSNIPRLLASKKTALKGQ